MREDLFAFRILAICFRLRENGRVSFDLFPSIVSYLILNVDLFIYGINLPLQVINRLLIIRGFLEFVNLWSEISDLWIEFIDEHLRCPHRLL